VAGVVAAGTGDVAAAVPIFLGPSPRLFSNGEQAPILGVLER
jgi:hypothetical protein